MANYADEYYAEVDAIIQTLRVNPFETPLPDPVPQQEQPLGPVGWVENADASDGEATVIINSDGITVLDGKISVINGLDTIIEDGVVRQVENDGADVVIDANGLTVLNGAINVTSGGNTVIEDGVVRFVENTGADVTIDATGLTILNGRIFLADYTGQSVLTPSGFAGAWTDFIAAYVYNATFRGTANDATAVTLVSDGLGANYEPSLSLLIPNWVVAAVSNATYSTLNVEPTGLYLEKTGASAASITVFQDVPVADGMFIDFNAIGWVQSVEAVDHTVEMYLTELDADHELLAGGLEDELIMVVVDRNFVGSSDFAMLQSWQFSPGTKFARVTLVMSIAATVTTHTSYIALQGVALYPTMGNIASGLTIISPVGSPAPGDFVWALGEDQWGQIWLDAPGSVNLGAGAFETVDTIFNITATDMAVLSLTRISSDASLILRSDLDEPSIEFGGGSGAPDIFLTRRTVGDLVISEASDGTGSPLLRIHGDTGTLGLIIEDPDDTTSRLLLGTNTGTPRLEFGSGTAARDVVITRLTNPGIRFEVGGNSEFEIVVDGRFILPNGGYFEMVERTAPSAPAANRGRLFVRDNGSGKSQLCIIFSSGAIQVIATQP